MIYRARYEPAINDTTQAVEISLENEASLQNKGHNCLDDLLFQ